MNINKVHCFFEQSGTFKNAFKYYGIAAEDYDIQNDYGETDNIIDIFSEIEKCYNGNPSIFDNIKKDDLIFAFFPCIHFCDSKTLFFKGLHISQKNWSISKIMKWNIESSIIRQQYYLILMKFFALVDELNLRLILENPYNPSGMSFLQNNFINPTLIDTNRMKRGDYFIKPTAYWFIGCNPTFSETYQKDKKQKIVMKEKGSKIKGLCSLNRSSISFDYALNFINDFIFGSCKRKDFIQQPDLFN